jgi:hypothetical protein
LSNIGNVQESQQPSSTANISTASHPDSDIVGGSIPGIARVRGRLLRLRARASSRGGAFEHLEASIKALTALSSLLGGNPEDAMTPRIFNILMGLWLFASAFVLPQGRVGFESTAICGLLTTVTAALSSYDSRSRYLTEAIGVLVVVLAFAVQLPGSATFLHNGVIGISIAVAAWADREPLAERYEDYGRDLFGLPAGA